MSSKKKWSIVATILALVLIFIAILLLVGEQLTLENIITISVVAAVMVYFIYLASSMKR